MYPIDSIQSDVSPWWEEHSEKQLKRGCLIFAFVPHVDQIPNTLTPVGRKNAKEHDKAIIRVSPLRIKAPRSKEDLPVAALSLFDGELWTAYRAKKRPCLVLGIEQPEVPDSIRRDMPRKLTSPTVLVAPYYGVDKDGTRSGYNQELVKRIRHAEYPQFFLDQLPIEGPKESLLRLDHIQPVGVHYYTYEHSGFALSDDAMELIIDDWLTWVFYGGLPEDSYILAYQEFVSSIEQN